MRVAIYGLGYVGCVSAACLARLGHDVVGVDVNAEKVTQVASGTSPILERGLAELIGEGVAVGRLSATTDGASAARSADLSLICVGTPSRSNGDLDTSYVETVVSEIGAALCGQKDEHTVVVRSTLLPGTTDGVLRPLLESALRERIGGRAMLAYNPEFLREGSAIADFGDPPYTIIGADSEPAAESVAVAYEGVDAPIHRVSIPEAELVKYAANAFHALKITFANEIGHFGKTVGVDSHRVMDLIAADTKLNVSRAYMRPGFAFGGSCLPKDLRAVLYAARRNDLELPMLRGIPVSNTWQVEEAVDLVMAQGSKRIGVLGITFKAGTDDLRESPVVGVVETLIGKGLHLSICDPNVQWARLVGANRRFIEQSIPHITELMVDSVDEVLDRSDVIVVGNGSKEFSGALSAAEEKTIIDLVRLPGTGVSDPDGDNGVRYHGICW